MTLLDYIREDMRRHRRAAYPPFQPPLGAFRDRSPGPPRGGPRRDSNGLLTAGREHEGRGQPHILPRCEEVVRAPTFDRPLTNLAITNCREPHNMEVVTVLWYLADQAHLLQINMRNLQFLPPQ